MMKAYFINPPAPKGVEMVREGRCMQRKGAWTAVWPPISLALCAALLEKKGLTVKLSDCIVEKINPAGLAKKIKAFKPNLVVINTSTPSVVSDLSICDLIKKINPKVKTAVFGIHVTALPEESFGYAKGLDVVVRGEPEETVLALAERIAERRSLIGLLGVTWRNGRKIVRNPARPWIRNLDQLPFPAWHLIDKNNYQMPFTKRPFFLVATGRGCPYQCLFCADKTYYGQKLRLRSPKRIVDELEHNQKTYGVSDFLFWTESFTINNQFALGVCDEIIRRELKVCWVCNSRVDNVSLKLLKRFKQAGCQMIGYGVESGNQEILNRVRKGTTLEQARKAVALAKKAELEVTGHCILGLPGETEESVEQTEKFVRDLGLDFVQFYCAVPFPGSDLYDLAQKEGWVISNDWARYEQNFSVLSYPGLSATQVMDLRRQAYKNFYLSPRTVIKTLLRLKSPREAWRFLGMAKEFLSWIR